jgi:hypothetical protein
MLSSLTRSYASAAGSGTSLMLLQGGQWLLLPTAAAGTPRLRCHAHHTLALNAAPSRTIPSQRELAHMRVYCHSEAHLFHTNCVIVRMEPSTSGSTSNCGFEAFLAIRYACTPCALGAAPPWVCCVSCWQHSSMAAPHMRSCSSASACSAAQVQQSWRWTKLCE